jgi:hypothetical protein
VLLEGLGVLTSAVHRDKATDLISEAHDAGAGSLSACDEIEIFLSLSSSGRIPRSVMPMVTSAVEAAHAYFAQAERGGAPAQPFTCKEAEYASLSPG